MNTALIYHPIYLKHNTGPHHPERPSRLQSILRKLQKTRLIDKLKLIEPKPASIENITSVHSKDYVLSIDELCRMGGASASCHKFLQETLGTVPSDPYYQESKSRGTSLDPDTVVSKVSYKSALFASGAVIDAIDLIFNGEVSNGFCMVRPPGHHARPSHAMGFCIFNNVAIGAKYIQTKYHLERILIIDWDAHHGNGTEEIFYKDPNVFYISLHQYPHYPGSGSKSFSPTLNIPMQAGSGDIDYIQAFQEIVIPKAKEFKPEFILISAGFDAHKDDPLSSINLTEGGFKEMTKMTKELANQYCENRIVSVLEGGYNLISLANSVYSHLEALLNDETK